MSKYYAVAIGRKVGVYRSWPECQAQTKGHPKALYKSFLSHPEAVAFIKRVNPDYLDPNALMYGIVRIPETITISDGTVMSTIMNKANWSETEPFVYTPFVPYRIGPETPGFTEFGKNYHLYDRNLLGGWEPYHIAVYIDGSKRPTVNHRGAGAYVRYRGLDYKFSVPFNNEVAQKYGFTKEEISKLSSPSMEYLALAEILWRLLALRLPEDNGFARVINPRLRLMIVGDYNGVKNFSEGSWQIKETHIAKIHQVCQAIEKWLKDRGIDLIFIHVNGHVGILGNEMADLAAKSTVACDTIVDWVTKLSLDLADRV